MTSLTIFEASQKAVIYDSDLAIPVYVGGGDGPAGAVGPPGPAGPASTVPGPAGADGKTILNGSGAPSSGIGANGDYYIDNTAHAIYGPKTAGA